MSRNFGLTRRDLPRERLISEQGWNWIKDSVAGFGLFAIMVGIAILEIKFPNGWHDIRAAISNLHFAIGAGSRVVLFLH